MPAFPNLSPRVALAIFPAHSGIERLPYLEESQWPRRFPGASCHSRFVGTRSRVDHPIFLSVRSVKLAPQRDRRWHLQTMFRLRVVSFRDACHADGLTPHCERHDTDTQLAFVAHQSVCATLSGKLAVPHLPLRQNPDHSNERTPLALRHVFHTGISPTPASV